MTTKLVYTGSMPTSFMSHELALEPGQVFSVPDDQLDRFIGRSDIELAPVEPEPVSDEEPAPKPAKKAAAQ